MSASWLLSFRIKNWSNSSQEGPIRIFCQQESGFFEYSPGFIHSKQILVDKDFAAVGTINLDYRSLLHHYENAVLLYKTESIAEIQKDFREIFSSSQEIFPHTIKNSWYQKLIKEIAQLFAPIL